MIDKAKVQEIKLTVGENAKGIIANGLGFKVKSGKVSCPAHDDSTPSMSWDKEKLKWHCFGCGHDIDIYSFLTDYKGFSFKDAVEEVGKMVGTSIQPNAVSKEQKYKLPSIATESLGNDALDYMNYRGIFDATLEFWRVKQAQWSGVNVFVFQYFENEKLAYVSYREIVEPGKSGFKGGCEAGTKPILYGMDHCDIDKPLVITEGQIDALTVWQCGYKNVVSMPSGANNLTWINHCWEWLDNFKMVIVFADNDKQGLECGEQIKRKLTNDKRQVKIIRADVKDANQLLMNDDGDKIIKLINAAINELPAGVKDVAEIDYRSRIYNQHEGVETGFFQIDKHIKDLKPSELTIILGRNGEGKTTFTSQMIAHMLEKQTPVFLFSGEMSEQKVQDWLYRQIVGNQEKYLQHVEGKYGTEIELRDYVVKAIKEWHKDKLYLFDQSVGGDTGFLLKTMEECSKRYGVKVFIIDNLMTAIYENATSLYSDQANFVQDCKNFAINNAVHVLLVAHPNKIKDELLTGDKGGNLEKTDISGSNNIANKADNIISVERIWGDGRIYDAIISVLKDREEGQRLEVNYKFSRETLRFNNAVTPESKAYSWVDYLGRQHKGPLALEFGEEI